MRLQDLKEQGSFLGEVEEIDWQLLDSQLGRANEYDLLAIGGGDGTVSSIINHSNGKLPKLALLPLGTGNDLAKELRIYSYFNPNNPEPYLRYLEKAPSRNIQSWCVNFGTEVKIKRRFINYLSFGYDAKIVGEFSETRKFNRGRFPLISRLSNRAMYGASAFQNLRLKIAPDIKVINLDNGLTLELNHPIAGLIFTNIRSIGGLGISQNVGDYRDELIEVVVTRSIFDYLAMSVRKYLGIRDIGYLGQAKLWQLEFLNPIDCQADGEPVELTPSVKVTITPAEKFEILSG